MREIAIVFGKTLDMEDEHMVIAKSITSWKEVSDEEYFTLSAWVNSINKRNSPSHYYTKDTIHIIHKPNQSILPVLIEGCMEAAENHKQQVEKEKLQKEKKRQEKEKLKLLKKATSEKELFEELKAKYLEE